MWRTPPAAVEPADPVEVERVPCIYCCGIADPSTTCPRAVECPRCHATPGSPCVRPSGHRADELHTVRVKLAEDQPPKETPCP